MSISSGLVVEGDRERERARLRVVEVIHAARAGPGRDRAAEVRLRIVPGVVAPGLQVAARHPEVDAREPEGALHPGRIKGVGHGDLAQLHKASVLDARLVDPDERAADHVPVPVLADVHRVADTRPHYRAVIPTALTEDSRVAGARRGIISVRAGRPHLGILVRAIAPWRALRAVPDLPAMPDV